LAATLGGGVREAGAVWVAAAMGDGDRLAAEQASGDGVLEVEGYAVRLVVVDPAEYRAYYDVIANQTLWFWHHHLFDATRRPRLDRRVYAAWESFRAVNVAMAEAADLVAEDGATVLVHDYHLSLVPALLRARRDDVRIVHFTHTAFVDRGLAGMLPGWMVDEVLDGLGGADACGFHSSRWRDAFLGCWDQIRAPAIAPRTFVAPAAPDREEVAQVAASAECAAELAALNAQVGDRACIVRVDRIELSKNLLRGFWAFAELLETRPEWRGRTHLVALMYPSREGLAEYLGHRVEVESAAEAVNRAYGSDDWTPVIVDMSDCFPRSVAALRRADVLLVNPVRDGLNLVAYEGPVVNERDAPLVLSYEAGAWDNLGPHAIGVNPFDVSATADALDTALRMPAEERSETAARLREAARVRSPGDWLRDQIAAAIQ
jgi:trehalose 6-phosphate synthase